MTESSGRCLRTKCAFAEGGYAVQYKFVPQEIVELPKKIISEDLCESGEKPRKRSGISVQCRHGADARAQVKESFLHQDVLTFTAWASQDME